MPRLAPTSRAILALRTYLCSSRNSHSPVCRHARQKYLRVPSQYLISAIACVADPLALSNIVRSTNRSYWQCPPDKGPIGNPPVDALVASSSNSGTRVRAVTAGRTSRPRPGRISAKLRRGDAGHSQPLGYRGYPKWVACRFLLTSNLRA